MVIAVQVVATYFFGPEIGAAAAAGLSSALNGGSLGDVAKAAAFAYASTYATQLVGAYARNATSSAVANAAINTAGHGVVEGTRNYAMGGKFSDGFYHASVANELGGVAQVLGAYNNEITGSLATSVVGGTASSVGGGKFANGAWTSAFAYLGYSTSANGSSSILGQTILSPVYGLRDFLTEESYPVFKDGMSTNLAKYKYFGTLGILTGESGARGAANIFGMPFFVNPTSGPLIDIFQTLYQKIGLLIGVEGSLTRSIGRQLNSAGIRSGADFYGHSQGAATTAGLFQFGYLSQGSMNLNGPAVDSITAKVIAFRTNSRLIYYEKPGDISGLFNFPNISNPLSPILAPIDIFLGAKIHTSYY